MPLPMNFNSLPLSRFFISVILKHCLSCGTQALIKTTFSQPSITCIANFQINKKKQSLCCLHARASMQQNRRKTMRTCVTSHNVKVISKEGMYLTREAYLFSPATVTANV